MWAGATGPDVLKSLKELRTTVVKETNDAKCIEAERDAVRIVAHCQRAQTGLPDFRICTLCSA